MEILTFFAGMQALAAFLQVWQTEQSSELAKDAYFRKKIEALESKELRQRAEILSTKIRNNPVLDKLLRNRFGRCEDAFEEALRGDEDDELNKAAQDFVRCKCIIMQVIRTAQGGEDHELDDEWDQLNCELILAEEPA